jgi:transcriptional regulator with XRE-family HTH domain
MDHNRSNEMRGSDSAVLADLGDRIARERLNRNLTQEALAAEAGVSRSTVRRLEAGESTQLTNLIRILRALGLLANFDALIPEPVVRPLEALERKGKERRRASSPARTIRRNKTSWTWGDDR